MARLSIQLPSSLLEGQRRSGNGRRSLARTLLLILLCIVAVTSLTSLTVLFVSGSASGKYFGECCSWGDGKANIIPENLIEHNFAVVIDAGSSGSRVFIYHWPKHDGDPSHLLKIDQLFDVNGVPVVKKVEPGLSAFADHPQDAYAYMKPLLDFAVSHIPLSKQEDTLLYVLATAGMRLLPTDTQYNIMEHLQLMIKSEYNFYLPESSVEVISGKLEGVYSWIAINYLLGKFDVSHHSSSEDGSPVINTVGSVDMGGGSIQVAFEIPEEMDEDILPCRVVDINLGCGIKNHLHKHRVYVTTFLGYGANEALRLYMQRHKLRHHKNSTNRFSVFDPCLPLHMTYHLSVSDIPMTLIGTGNYTACRESLIPLLSSPKDTHKDDKDFITAAECSEDTLYELPINFTTMPFYGFSEFWYTMNDILGLGGAYERSSFDSHAAEFCHTSWDLSRKRYMEHLYPKAGMHRLKYQCFKSSWMSLILHNALGFPQDYSHLQSANQVHGRNVQWTLGALLYRTRFMPLREIPQEHQQSLQVSWSQTIIHQLLLPFGFVLVTACLLVLYRTGRPRHHIRSLSRNVSYNTMSRCATSNDLTSIKVFT
ncbi:ectonucleoside triphosphate diphosphohydrolase 7-like isoform X2 [Dysidea avara]|uniref:ectonucleoside triphosphate diphosphohydrolase 7-like isoform X2 n=1 Tax=Dysidea avara TaxID=196820 RepID=UPI00332C6FAA